MNLGLQEREQPDISIASDINSIDLKINGYSHKYTYGQRFLLENIDIFSEITKYKNKDNANYPKTYERKIYSSYVYSSGITGTGALQDEDKLEFDVIYEIEVSNESSSLYISANEITNYCDKTFDLNSIESWYIDSNNTRKDIEWKQDGTENEYQKIMTTSLSNEKIEHGKSLTIYLKLKKKSDEVYSWARQTSSTEVHIADTYNITELTSYSSYTKSGNTYSVYAGIDEDSAPDNINPGEENTYEDDTDSAPVLSITFDEPRTISGYIFEDSTGTELKPGETRNGDGKYNASEDGYIANVKAELFNAETNEVVYLYPNAVSDNSFDADVAEYTTTKDGKGYYEFKGIIPGKYYIKFTYGDGSVIYKTVNGTEESTNVSIQNYKSTIITSDKIKIAIENQSKNQNADQKWYQDNTIKSYSSAIDDYSKRQDINSQISTINYKTETDYLATKSSMEATTPIMDIAIENSDEETTELDQNRIREYDNIDFGIAERARQNINIYKEISYVKLMLVNGQVLVEGDPRTGNLNYVRYPQGGMLNITVDSEIIEGATLEVTYEIKVENNSELDYNNEDYYKYGEINNNVTPVSTTIDAIVDYMDEGLTTSYTYDTASGEWYLVKANSNALDAIPVSEKVYKSVKNNNNILIIKNPNLKNGTSTLAPKESGIITVSASKLLTSSLNMQYDNKVEILGLTNEIGRFNGQVDTDLAVLKWKLTTPGNFDPTQTPTENDESYRGYANSNRRASLSVLPPEGGNQGNIRVICIIVGISCLVVIAVSIVIIKKNID